MELSTYEEAFKWASGAAKTAPRLLLGNGFSVNYDSGRFSYRALRQRAEDANSIGPLATKLFANLDTFDFERVIQELTAAARALKVIDSTKHAADIQSFEAEADALKEVLARTLANLHPERPTDIGDDAYVRVRNVLDQYQGVYTTNYDLLLYWASMQDKPPLENRNRYNDGFRDPGYDASYVIWDRYEPVSPTVNYVHGALHLYRDSESGELKKLTWTRTGDALIDQIRQQLSSNRFPLIVTEGSSATKLSKIQTSDYLGRCLRSLAGIGGGLLIYGLSLSDNDAHLTTAVMRSNVSRLAVSIYGDPENSSNQATIHAAMRLTADREVKKPHKPLEVRFFDAGTIRLWQ